MEWFILSRDMHVLCAPSTDSPNSLPIFDDKQTILLSNNTVVSTYDFSVQQKHPDAQNLQMGNYIVFVDKYHKTKMYTLMSHDGDDLTHTWHAEDVGLDLLNESSEKWDYTGQPHDIAWYLDNLVLKDSGWTIGINEASTLTRALKFDGETDTQLRRLGDIANQFDGAEIDFTIEMNGAQVTKQAVNIYKKVGSAVTQGRYIDSVNLKSLHSSGSIGDLITAVKPFGAQMDMPEGQEGEAPRITIADVAYDDGRYYSPKGHLYLYDREARQQWSRFRAYNYANQGEFDGYIVGSYTYETKDANELLNRGLTELKSRNKPSETYEANLLDINADIGDYVQIAHNQYNPPIYLSARVESVTNCYTANGQDTGILGDYRKLESQIDPRIKEMIDELKDQIKPNYTWIRYAKDDKGTGMTATPTADTKYVAIVSNKPTGVPSDDPSDYAGHWQLIQGQDGKDGIPGATGADGKTSYTHFAYANNVSGTLDFSTDDPTGRSYMGVYSDFTKPDSNNPSDYVWSLTKGESGTDGMQGAQGPKGEQGIAGKPGADGKTSYTHVAYADNASGGGFSQNPANKAYMGWYTDFTANDSTDPAKYAWSLIKGSDGSNGAPGKPGADGKTPYFHQAWADSKDGKINFSTTDPTNRGYLGTYSDFTQVDSTDPSKYFWVELVGNILTGAPNLIKNTGNFKNDKHWQHNGTLTFTERHPFWKNGAEPLFKLQTTGTTEVTLSSDRFPLIRSEEYTVQFDGFHNGNISSIDVWILSRKYGSSAGFDKTQLIKGAFQLSASNTVHTTIKFTAPSDVDEAYLRFDNNGSKTAGQAADLWITDIKVAHENRPSPWSPSPEDAQEQIDSVNEDLGRVENLYNSILTPIASVTAPTNPKTGQQWWVLDANGKTMGFKIWSGSAWKDATIQQSALNIDVLNGNTLNGATINTSNFNMSFDQTNSADGVNKKGTTTIRNGELKTDFQIKNTTQTGHVYLTPQGLSTYASDTDGSELNSIDLSFGTINLATKGVDRIYRGTLDGEDVEQTAREVWDTTDPVNGQYHLGFSKQFRRVWLDGVIVLPRGSGNVLFRIKEPKLWPKSTKWIALASLGENGRTAQFQINSSGNVYCIANDYPGQRYIAEGSFYLLDI